jgi:hypothetical protein
MNGGFESTTLASNALASQIRLPGQTACTAPNFLLCGIENGPMSTQVPTGARRTYPVINDWTAQGFVMLFKPQTGTTSGTSADNTGAYTQFQASWRLYGPGNFGSGGNDIVNNGLTLSPNGGNFVVLDGDATISSSQQSQGQISQTIQHLDPGLTYGVSFFWAAAQQFNHPGETMEQLRVSFCAPGQSAGPGVSIGTQVSFEPEGRQGCSEFTQVVTNPHAAFHPWTEETFDFKASSSTEVLSFLALGHPEGGPPLVLVDGVSMAPVPEPSTWLLLGIGLALIVGIAYYRRPNWVNVA